MLLPPANAVFDYQLGGAYAPAADVRIVDRDRLAPPAPGVYSVCYVNAFQTQPAELAHWRRAHPDLLLRKRGRPVVDAAWGERLLDTSTAAKRRALLRVVGPWIDGCARSGFQAVEPDNLDSYSRSKGALTLSDNKAFATMLIRRAHHDGLAIAQKNTAELASGRARAGVRLRDRRGVPGLRRVRYVHEGLRRRGLRDRVPRQRRRRRVPGRVLGRAAARSPSPTATATSRRAGARATSTRFRCGRTRPRPR